MPDERVAALKRITILKDLKEASFEAIVRACTWHTASQGELIFSVKDNATDLYFLLSGKVQVVLYSSEGKPVLFVTLSAGDIVGEVSAIDGFPRSATVEAIDDCTLASLSAAAVERLIMEEPAFGLALSRRLASHIRRLSERVFEFSTLAVQNRIHAELLRLATLAGSDSGEVLLSPAPSLTDIAARIAARREGVSREVNRLIQIGLLKRVRGGLRILDIKRLSDLVREARGE